MSELKHKRHTLVLNKHFVPLAVVGAKKCMKYLLNDGTALDPVTYEKFTFDEWVLKNSNSDKVTTISTEKYYILIPEIIQIDREHIKKKPTSAKGISKKKVFDRDDWKCGYCLEPVSGKTATVDHVIPVSKGGKSTYDNLVTCCGSCNRKKGDTPLVQLEQQGWKLHHKLGMPKLNSIEYITEGKCVELDSWKPFLKSII